MANTQTIPAEERSPQLKEFLDAISLNIAQIKTNNKVQIPDDVPLLFLIFPWVGQPTTPDQEKFLATRRAEFEAGGFDGTAVQRRLLSILEHDKHLRECCVGPGQLAHCLDLNFVSQSSSLILAKAPPERIEDLFQQFVSTIYRQGRFKIISLCHLFNFQSDQPSLVFGNVRVERLDSPTIARILGETSAVSFIHPPGTGEYFIVSEREGLCDDHINWVFEEKNKAELFMHVLEYFKDGVVHIDYAVPHFMPPWVNQLRKWGVFFIGNPRRLPYEGGQRFYTVRNDERDSIARWWTAYQDPAIIERISDLRHSLRQAGLRAAEYFELSHGQEKPADRLISLAIALEALFSPDDKGEFTFRISQSLSQLVGTTAAERTRLFQDTRKFYSRRSELVHGQYDVDAFLGGRFVTHQECERWASPIRQAILRFLVLYLRGEDERIGIHKRLSDAALDEEAADRLRRESDVEAYLTEILG